jgi:drug/metabolite transporter (DMT)-like permease
MGFHLLRVLLSVITLSASFFAIPRVPFAVFTAVGFTRPLVTMVMAAVLLRETIGARRWIAAGVAFAGVLIAVNPGAVDWSWGLAALVVVVFSGSGAVIATRRLREAPPIVMMTFYTAGLTVFSAPMALWRGSRSRPGTSSRCCSWGASRRRRSSASSGRITTGRPASCRSWDT